MRNIHDLFEENKKEFYYVLNESDDIVNNFKNDAIEWQTACYMEDLVLEQMMYEDFNADEMEFVIEATMKERLFNAMKFIKDNVDKFLNWLDDVLIKFSEKMNVYVALYDKIGRNNIHAAIQASNTKVKVIDIKGYGSVAPVISKLIDGVYKVCNDRIEELEPQVCKSSMLNELDVKSVEEISEKIKNSFVNSYEPVEKQINDFKPDMLIGWLEGKNIQREIADLKRLKRIMQSVKLQSRGSDDGKNIVSNCSFIISVMRKIITTTMSYYYKVTNVSKNYYFKSNG